MENKLVIYGIGPFAKLMRYYFSADGGREVAGFTVDEEYLTSDSFENLPVIPFRSVESRFPPGKFRMFVAIGYQRMRNRPILFDKAKRKGYELVNYVNRRAIVYEDLKMGENNAILGNVNIEPGVELGNNNIVWSDTLLGHDLKIGDHNYISAKCLIAGNSVIRDLCFIGNGAVTINDLTIEDETHVFPGAVLFKNSKTGGRYMGNPARHVGTHRGDGIVITRG